MMLTLYGITEEERYVQLAGWIFGDYYDVERYKKTPQWHILDSGDPYTDKWGAGSAEDALRMMAKYLWHLKYPKLAGIIKASNKSPAAE